MNKTWFIKENIVKVLEEGDISRTKLDETTWVDNDGNLMIPNALLKSKPKRSYDVLDIDRFKYRQELSLEIGNLVGKPILFSKETKESNIIGIGILTGFSTEFAEINGIRLSFKNTEIIVRDGRLFNFIFPSVSTEHWTEIRELSMEEFEEIKTKLLNYYRKPFRIKYEID